MHNPHNPHNPSNQQNQQVTFLIDQNNLESLRECDPIHINTFINIGIKLAFESEYFKRFLTSTPEKYIEEYKESMELSDNSKTTESSITTTQEANPQALPTQQSSTNDLDFSNLFS